MRVKLLAAAWVTVWALLALGAVAMAGCHSCGCH